MARSDIKMFTFRMDESSDVPLWVQLKSRIAFLISTGFYQPGEQLPTIRKVASDISINYNTVNKAYLALRSEGYIESVHGSGVYVRDLSVTVDEDVSAEVDSIVGDFIASCRSRGLSLDDVRACVDAKVRHLKVEEGVVAEGLGEGSRIVTIRFGGKASSNQVGA